MNLEIDPLYIEARRVLIDALEALVDHRDAMIVVGAQAVYLRTGASDIPVAPFTTDGDITLDPSRLGDAPTLGEAMENAGFELQPPTKPEPGIWIVSRVVDGKSRKFPVDLIVPSEFASKAGKRGARLGPHGKLAARKTPGLEAALLDNSTLSIRSLDETDDRVINAKVAGPTALLLAKAHKIQERMAHSARPDRVLDKDAGDVFRLLQTSDPQDCARLVMLLIDHERIGPSARSGVGFFIDQFKGPGSPGTALAIQYFRRSVPEDRVRAVCTGFVADLESALGTL